MTAHLGNSTLRVTTEAASAQLPQALEDQLSAYLVLATEALKRDENERAEKAIKDATQKRIVELCTWLALLLGYSILVGFVSSSTLVSSLVDPAAVGRRIAGLGELPRRYQATVPDDVRSIIFTLVSAAVVILLRVASLSARSALGGTLFLGIATLSLLGLAAAMTTGTGGLLVAAPGLVAVFIVIYQFLRFLRETVVASGRSRRLHAIRQSLIPGGDRRRIALFVSVPLVAVIFIGVAASTNSHAGFLYWASRLSQIALLVWFVWACVATPPAIRIPLWSVPIWGAIVLTLFTYGPVAVIFAVAVLVVLFANVFIAALPERVQHP